MPDLLSGFESFCQRVTVPATKEYGAHLLWPLFATQEYFLSEVRAGLEAGIHEFIVLKGRQQGLTTICDALDLWYLQSHPGMLGMIVLDDIDNQNFRRLMLRGMLASLPRALRFPVGEDNRSQLVWRESPDGPMRSILLYANAGKREDSNNNLGRSKGVNYLHGDEVGAWLNDKAVSAVQDSLAERHPERLYLWGSTAQGFGPFREMWLTAQEAATQRAIFIGWWRHALYRVARGTDTWTKYAGPPSKEEREWMREVKRRYGVTIDPEQLVWYRYRLEEKYRGDESMRMQEHPCVPTDAFVAFGEKFIPHGIIRGLRAHVERAAKPDGFRYEFGKYLDTTKAVACAPGDARLKVWEEPQNYAVYVLAAHPWGSSSDKATAAEVQVWRAWPDVLELVAEYHTEDPDMYQFAWVCLHMMAAYRSFANSHSYNPVFFILEIGWGGERVLREIDNIRSRGYGLSSEVVGREQFLNMTGCIEYFFRRIDASFSSSVSRQSKTNGEERARKLFALRDELTREHLVIPSPALVDELSMLRLGEEGHADEIGGGAQSPEARAITAAMAVICRLDQDVDTAVRTHIAPKHASEQERHVGEVLVGNALGRLIRTGRM